MLSQFNKYSETSNWFINTYFLYFLPTIVFLTHIESVFSIETPENIRKPYGFLMFSGGPKREHWLNMG